MKRDIPKMHVKRDWSPMLRPMSLSLAFLILIGSLVLAAGRRKSPAEGPPPRVLMIGDSLSVASFGETLEQHLERRYGRENVAFFASCGSSPENWLSGEPVFYTKCGYRQRTPTSDIYRDFHNGKPPSPVRTPKLENLLANYKPTIVIVQLGTNWMDRSLSDDKIRSILDQFMSTARRGGRRIVWITPPDSSRFSKTQGRIQRLISQAKRSGVSLISSRRLTQYVPGKTGGDGVHYNRESGEAWARKVIAEYDEMFPRVSRKMAASE